MNLMDIVFNDATKLLLFENGKSDAARGVNLYNGWREVCASTGYSEGRTPAREAYEDGWYSYRRPENGKG